MRNSYAAYPGEKADTTWLVSWPESALKAMELFEEMIYGTSWDARIKDAIRSKHKVEEFFQYESVQCALNEIIDLVRAERCVTAPGVHNAGSAGAESADHDVTADEAKDNPIVQLPVEQREQWTKYVDKLLDTYVVLVPEGKTQQELENSIKASNLTMVKGDPTGLVIYYFDVKSAGECQTQPRRRRTPLRDAIYTKMVRAATTARTPPGSTPHLRAGEVAIVMDGSRRGNQTKLLAPWRENISKKVKEDGEDDVADDDDDDDDDEDKANFNHKVLTVVYSEEALSTRRTRKRGTAFTAGLSQVEWAHMLSSNKITLPDRARKFFPGTTAGDTIMEVTVPELATEWQLPWATKKQIYSKKHIIPVGGKGDQLDEAEAAEDLG